MKLQIVFTTLFCIALISTGLAHALWIETEPSANIGQPHSVKIFYGEYAAKEFEKTEKWYADINTFELWLTTPDGKKKQLTYSAAADHYTASFTPDRLGTHILTIGHSANEVNRGYVYQFNASAAVRVGKSETITQALTSNELYLQTEQDPKGKAGIVRAYYKGQPAAEIEITVSGPTGWSKSFKTDKNGVLQFEPLWKGTYSLEGFYTTDETGTRNEKNYEHIWRCATTRAEFSN
jgi:uncharacterized GH25 family protein